ncbi:hypothetical protein V5799_023540 [Amblyomma americanum]|uniref:Myb/SANT-like DNA-binding domain-containing protein n=1 Tax=Amblyomma americanum TaxID=6943 RepID=A0AAQ4FIS5_AMBAM
MANLGYHWTWQQLRNCWKNLKKRFTAERLEQERSGAAASAWKWYDHMSALLSHRPMVQAREYGVDSQDVPPDYGDNSQLDISDADTRTEEDDADILQEQSERSQPSTSDEPQYSSPEHGQPSSMDAPPNGMLKRLHGLACFHGLHLLI